MVDTRRRAGYLGQCSWGRTPDRSRLGLLISGQDTSPEPHLHRLAVNNGLSRVPPGEVPSIERVLSPGRSRTYDHERFVVKRAAPLIIDTQWSSYPTPDQCQLVGCRSL